MLLTCGDMGGSLGLVKHLRYSRSALYVSLTDSETEDTRTDTYESI